MIRILLIILMTLALLDFSWAMQEEAVVIEVRKKVKLHAMERVYSDFFIRGGSKLGLSKGVLVSVVRRVPVHDPYQNASIGDFKIKVADLEIIQVDSEKSIGRLVKIDRREARPMLTYDAVMIGDRLDLETMRSKVSYQEPSQSVFEKTTRTPASIETETPEPKSLEPTLTKPMQ